MELLVVVAILAALLGLLLPSLIGAGEAGRLASCMSRQKQIGLAMLTYTHEYGGSFPIARYQEGSGAGAEARIVEWDAITHRGEVAPGLIWSYAGDGRVQQCPSHRGRSNTLVAQFSGYNYNTSYIGRGQNEGVWGGMTEDPARRFDLRDPYNTALIGDGGYAAGANKFMRAPFDKAGDYIVHAGAQAYRHAGASTNVIWADGHNESITRRHLKRNAPAQMKKLLGWPTNGFLSEDDRAYDRE